MLLIHLALLATLYLYQKAKTFLYLKEKLNVHKTALARKGTAVL